MPDEKCVWLSWASLFELELALENLKKNYASLIPDGQRDKAEQTVSTGLIGYLDSEGNFVCVHPTIRRCGKKRVIGNRVFAQVVECKVRFHRTPSENCIEGKWLETLTEVGSEWMERKQCDCCHYWRREADYYSCAATFTCPEHGTITWDFRIIPRPIMHNDKVRRIKTLGVR